MLTLIVFVCLVDFVTREADFSRTVLESLGAQEQEMLTKIQARHREFQEELAKAEQERAAELLKQQQPAPAAP